MVARTLAAAREAGLDATVWCMPPLPHVFTAMPWGGDSLPAETRTRLAHLRVVWREVRPLTIVETVEPARTERLLT